MPTCLLMYNTVILQMLQDLSMDIRSWLKHPTHTGLVCGDNNSLFVLNLSSTCTTVLMLEFKRTGKGISSNITRKLHIMAVCTNVVAGWHCRVCSWCHVCSISRTNTCNYYGDETWLTCCIMSVHRRPSVVARGPYFQGAPYLGM